MDDRRQLIDALARVIGLGAAILGSKVPPLEAVHRAKIALLSMAQTDLVEVLSRSIAIPNLPNTLSRELRQRASRRACAP